MLQQWTGKNIYGCAEWIMWSANSDKWNSRMIASWGGSQSYGCGTNQVLENWVDKVAIVPTNNAKASTCNNGWTGENSDFGDFWVSDPVNNPQGNKYEDETGAWHAVAPIDPDTSAIIASFTIRKAPPSPNLGYSYSRDRLMGYDLGKDIGMAPLTVKLDGRYSSGKNLTYQWNFGDGTTGTGDTVRHTYNAVGNYAVVLTAANGATQNQKSRIIYVVNQSMIPVNIAQGKTASASTAATDAPKVVDGDFGTVWSAKGGNWLTVDLGSAQSFNRIVVRWTGGGCGYPTSYQAKTSNDNSSWTTIATLGTNPAFSHEFSDTLNGAYSARYVQVNLISTFNGACGAELREVQVFNVPQGPFSNGSTGTAPFVWKAVSDVSFGVNAAKGRVGLAFNMPAQRNIALFSPDGSLLASSVSMGTHASLSANAASGSIVIVRVTQRGKSPIVQRIAVR
jgi:PKD repeat protein